MGIPSTKASTANVDQGSDLISQARPDIKQNIDNVNEIIDHLEDSAKQKVAVIKATDTEQVVSGSTYKKASEILFNTDNILTNSTYTFDLIAGTYLVTCNDYINDTSALSNYVLYNETDTANFAVIETPEVGTTNTHFYKTHTVVTIGATKTIGFRITSTDRTGLNPTVIIHKIQ